MDGERDDNRTADCPRESGSRLDAPAWGTSYMMHHSWRQLYPQPDFYTPCMFHSGESDFRISDSSNLISETSSRMHT